MSASLRILVVLLLVLGNAVFVAAVSVHAPIGLRTVLSETLAWRGRGLEWTVFAIGIALAFLGFRALWAVFL